KPPAMQGDAFQAHRPRNGRCPMSHHRHQLRLRRRYCPPMGRKALIALASVLVLGVLWVLPAFSEPAHRPCTGEDEGGWSYKVDARTWDCTSLGWHIGRYGFSGI